MRGSDDQRVVLLEGHPLYGTTCSFKGCKNRASVIDQDWSYCPEHDPENIIPVNRFVVRRDQDTITVSVQVAGAGLVRIARFDAGVPSGFFRGVNANELQHEVERSKMQIGSQSPFAYPSGMPDCK